MPLYEYACQKCSHLFEELVFGASTPICPSCGGDKLERLMSVVSARVADNAPPPTTSACGRCGDPRGPGACRN
jgi:putative FmdB family regulatory protein